MPDIHITVMGKIATGDQSRIVCGNSDYVAVFDFDAEWAAYETKTARFVYPGGVYVDVVFDGETCPVPVLHNTIGVKVGVFAGNLHTTTSAWFECDKSILCGGGSPAAPPDDVYNQIMELLNKLDGDMGAAVEEYLKEHPVEGMKFDTDETLALENGILSVNTADKVEQDNTLPVTSAAVHVTVGNIETLLGTI